MMNKVKYVVVSRTSTPHGASSESEATFNTIAEAIEFFDWVVTLPDNWGNVTKDWVERREIDVFGNVVKRTDCNIQPRFDLTPA